MVKNIYNLIMIPCFSFSFSFFLEALLVVSLECSTALALMNDLIDI